MNIISFQNNYNKTPVFQGYSRELHNSLDRILRKPQISPQDELILSEAVNKAYSSIIKPDRFIERGTHNSVYKITRKYAARIPNDMVGAKTNVIGNMKLGRGVFKDLTNYFGEAIVEFGRFQILKNIGKHRPAGVPKHISENLSKTQVNHYYLTRYLPIFSRVPQSSYDEFALNLASLNEIKTGIRQYCAFDSLNPNNVVLKKGKLYLVDDIDTMQDMSYANTTAKMFEVFLNKATYNQASPEGNDEQVKMMRKILKKVLLAASNAQLVHVNSKEDAKNWQIAFAKCHIKDNAEKILISLEKIEYPAEDKVTRRKKVTAFINRLFIKNPINEI